MTSKYIECSIVIDLCNKRLEEYETGRKQNLEKWIKKYSYYTTGMFFWKQKWERCRQSTIAYLDSKEFKEDTRYSFEYIIERSESLKAKNKLYNSIVLYQKQLCLY